MRRPAQAAIDVSGASFTLAGQDSTVSNGGGLLLRAASTASVVMQTGASASFSARVAVFAGDLVLGTRSGSPVTFGGAASESSAHALRLLGQSTTSGVGGDLVLSAGRSGAEAQAGGSVVIDAGTSAAGSLPAEVQVATASVCLHPLLRSFSVPHQPAASDTVVLGGCRAISS